MQMATHQPALLQRPCQLGFPHHHGLWLPPLDDPYFPPTMLVGGAPLRHFEIFLLLDVNVCPLNDLACFSFHFAIPPSLVRLRRPPEVTPWAVAPVSEL